MIDISQYLQNILHAIYGKDVRQSIHDGIKKIAEGVNSAVDSQNANINNKFEAQDANINDKIGELSGELTTTFTGKFDTLTGELNSSIGQRFETLTEELDSSIDTKIDDLSDDVNQFVSGKFKEQDDVIDHIVVVQNESDISDNTKIIVKDGIEEYEIPTREAFEDLTDEVDRRINRLSTIIEDPDNGLETMEARVTAALESQNDKIDDKFDEQDRSIANQIQSSLSAQNTAVDNKISALENNVSTALSSQDTAVNERLSAFDTTVNNRLTEVRNAQGNLSDLQTSNKSTLVAAINEAAKTGSSSGGGSDIVQDPADPNGGLVTDGVVDSIDETLSLSGYAAEAKATGDAINSLKESIAELDRDALRGSVDLTKGEEIPRVGDIALDRTLTDSNAAAPADIVGTLKGDVGDLQEALIGAVESALAVNEVIG